MMPMNHDSAHDNPLTLRKVKLTITMHDRGVHIWRCS
jgi:hypothetical protein